MKLTTTIAPISRNTFGLLLACLAATGSASLAADDITLTARQPWTNFFANAKVKLEYQIESEAGAQCRVSWNVAIARQTVASREAQASVKPGQPGLIAIDLELPDVKPGIVLPAELQVAVYLPGQAEPAAREEKTLWIFPEDALADRQQWLKDLQITLFDPKGATAKVFEGAGVPFKLTKSVDAVGDLSEGLLVIAEGLSFREHRALWAAAAKVAAAGSPVLCLAPRAGSLAIPGGDADDLAPPQRVVWARNDIITDIDKRLDTAWAPDGQPIASSLRLKSEARRVSGDAAPGTDGWPWLEVTYPSERGRVIVCGFAVIEKWEDGPTPRYLLARMLDRLSGDTEQASPDADPDSNNSTIRSPK